MIKKIILLLILLLCVSCSTDNKTVETNTEEYIEPVRDIFIFDEIDKTLQNRIKIANGGKEFRNKQFKMLFKDVYDEDLTDIDGQKIDLKDYDNLLVEVVSVTCSHCKKQIALINEFADLQDIQFVQYFNVGEKQDILDFYAEAGVEIPENIIVIAKDNNFKDYLINNLGIELYPTLLSFKDDKLQFNCAGEIDLDTYNLFKDISFNDSLKPEDFIDADGNNIIDKNRTVKDVENSLSKENLEKFNSLNKESKEATLKIIGSLFDYDNIANNNDKTAINEVEDFAYYKDKKTVYIFTYLMDEYDYNRVTLINELMSDKQYEYVVVLVDGFESSSSFYKDMDVKFDCPVITLTSKVPEDLFKVEMPVYPGALFVDRGVFTGVYSDINNKETFDEALQMFLSDKSIAYKRNN